MVYLFFNQEQSKGKIITPHARTRLLQRMPSLFDYFFEPRNERGGQRKWLEHINEPTVINIKGKKFTRKENKIILPSAGVLPYLMMYRRKQQKQYAEKEC